MNCKKYGVEITTNENFCSECGEKLQTNPPTEAISKDEIKLKKGKRYKKVILIVAFVIIASIVSSMFFGTSNRKSEIEYTDEDILKFCEILIKNVRNGEAEIYESQGDLVKINVKLDGYQEEIVWVHFSNINETDKVRQIYFEVSESKKENFYNCSIAVAEAIERTVCGKSEIKQYADFTEYQRILHSQPMIGGDKEVIGEYSLSSETKSLLYCQSRDLYYIFNFMNVY